MDYNITSSFLAESNIIFLPSPFLTYIVTQGGKGSSEGKKVQQSLTSKLNIGMFMWFKFVKIKRIHEAILEGCWYTGRIVHQLWAEWAVRFNCYLQNGFVNILLFTISNQFNTPITYFEVRICWTFFSSELPLPPWVTSCCE